ncbi:hypothetical protein SERLA73DRAFT_80215 [Serpula lacrymans var. lacrymans S7.3]|uniref:Peptidase S9 prolyl oligopeptidase catalytic domain-containing protein n=1 Tax=Serpula lacrymans var. lacrymans (strain S7.3) TaxID=936435 RepID=F8QJ37_SERL3|nr:hypothetical protein SERLA73DRAFT_80215 [Serpula lacrymans var. lacrymans S7.3]
MSDQKKVAPYGRWDSDIKEETVVNESITLLDVLVDPVRSTIYHIAQRADGTNVIVDTIAKNDVIGPSWDATSNVQGYGGAPAIAYDGIVYFSNGDDGRVYRVNANSDVEAVTPENPVHYFANFVVYPLDPRILVAVLEDHTDDAPKNVITTLCIIDTTSQSVTRLALDIPGADFYASPCFSPDGKKIAWQQWNFPDMPWDGSKLYVADFVPNLQTYVVSNSVKVAGEAGTVSVTYPSWANNTTLVFTSDKDSGFQNPWKYTIGGIAELAIDKALEEDFGFPAWELGWSPYAFLDKEGNNALFMAYRNIKSAQSGRSVLYNVNIKDKTISELVECPYADITSMRRASRDSPQVVFIGEKSVDVGGVTLCTLSSPGTTESPVYETLVEDTTPDGHEIVKKGYISPPQSTTFNNSGGQVVQVVYYAPHNPDYSGSSKPGEKPPCILNVHGGPTAMEPQALSWEKQYYTSRGLDVNYGGSSCFGREYISRLDGGWGVLDVQDCIDAIRALSKSTQFPIDGNRAIIRGRSSGGYATLAAMSIVKDEDLQVFAAGSSYAGISDLIADAKTTHKYESEYDNKLLGGTYEEEEAKYIARSPVHHAKRIKQPLLVLQGLQDVVVSPEQAELIVNAITENHPNDYAEYVDYVTFADEGHHFDKAVNRITSMKAERGWYESKVLPIEGA